MKSIERILRFNGEKAKITKDDETVYFDAIIQPMNRKWKTYLSGERVPSGVLNNHHFYMIACPELSLNLSVGDIVKCSDKEYVVRSRGDFKVKDKRMYVWAVLAARTEPAEDDYD